MVSTVKNPAALTPEEIDERHEAIRYTSQRLSQPEWHGDPTVKFALRREFSHALSEILRGHHVPFEWTFA